MKQLSTLPENGVLNRIQMLTALGVCQRLKMANPLIEIEDTNLITFQIAGFAYSLSKEEGDHTYTARSLRVVEKHTVKVMGYRMTAHADGDEILNEWHVSFEQALGSMFNIMVIHMADDIANCETQAADAAWEKKHAKEIKAAIADHDDPREGVSWSPCGGFSKHRD